MGKLLSGFWSSTLLLLLFATEQEVPARPEESLPPPIESKRTDNGMVSFENVILPGAPPMYRPYMVMDEEARLEKAKQMAKTGKKVPKDKLQQGIV